MLNDTSINVDLHVSIMLEVRLLKAMSHLVTVDVLFQCDNARTHSSLKSRQTNSRTALFLSVYALYSQMEKVLFFFSRDEVNETTRT